jgi:hypothetical protein
MIRKEPFVKGGVKLCFGGKVRLTEIQLYFTFGKHHRKLIPYRRPGPYFGITLVLPFGRPFVRGLPGRFFRPGHPALSGKRFPVNPARYGCTGQGNPQKDRQ